jgi:lipopolysaccharide export system protein LptA
LKRQGLTVQSDEMDVFFEAAGEKGESQGNLRQAVARGNVEILEQEGTARAGRRGVGQYAEFFPQTEKVILKGSPARVHSAQNDQTRGSELTYYLDDDRLLVLGNETDPSYTYRRGR